MQPILAIGARLAFFAARSSRAIPANHLSFSGQHIAVAQLEHEPFVTVDEGVFDADSVQASIAGQPARTGFAFFATRARQTILAIDAVGSR